MEIISFKRKELSDALRIIGKCVKRSSLPALESVLFTSEEEQLILKATNLEVYGVVRTSIRWPKEYELSVPYKELMKVVNTSRAKAAWMTVEEEDGEVKVTTHTSDGKKHREVKPTICRNLVYANRNGSYTIKSHLNTRKLDEEKAVWENQFPEFPSADKLLERRLAVIEVNNDLETTIKAAAKDESRPALTGVAFDLSSQSVLAADGFELAETSDIIKEVVIPPPDDFKGKPVVPASSFLMPAKIKQFTMVFYRHQNPNYDTGGIVKMVADNVTIYSQIIQFTPPNYNDVINLAGRVDPIKQAIDLKDLEALRGTTQLCANRPDQLMLYDPENGYVFQAPKSLNAEVNVIANLNVGLGGRIVLNPNYLVKAFAHLLGGQESVKIDVYYNNETGALRMDNCSRKFIVMPMHGGEMTFDQLATDKSLALLNWARAEEESEL